MARTLKTPSVLDLRFQSFGQYLVLGKGKKTKHGQFWVCQCACNQQAEIHEAALLEGRAKSCGCDYVNSRGQYRGPGYYRDLTGQQYGNMLVLQRMVGKHLKKTWWQCQCTCGQEAAILRSNLLSGNSRQCKRCAYSNLSNIVTQRWYGAWFVLERGQSTPHGAAQYLCRCGRCGREILVASESLRTRTSQSCGCPGKGQRRKTSLLYHTFGRLYVIEKTEKNKHGQTCYLCQCVCKAKTLKIVPACKLLSGKTQSCGCLAREKAAENMRQYHLAKANHARLDWTLDILRRHGAMPPEDRAPQSLDKNGACVHT